MRLLVLTEDFHPDISGGALVKWRMCQIANNRGHDVCVLTPRDPGTSFSERRDGIHIVRPFPNKPSSSSPDSVIATITRILSTPILFLVAIFLAYRFDADAVFSGSNSLHWIAATLEEVHGLPAVGFVGYTPSLNEDKQSRVKLWLEHQNFAHGLPSNILCRIPEIKTTIEAVSDSQVDLVQGILNEEEIRTAKQEAVETGRRNEYADDKDERLLVFIGRLTEIKNVPGAIRILSDLPDWYRLIVVGDGPERDRVESTIRDAGVSDRVVLTGQLSHSVALQVVSIADALLLTSRAEAFPTVVFEGLATGCHVFATPVSILSSLESSRIHVQEIDEFPDAIQTTKLQWSQEADEETLRTYSMEQYTDRILAAVQR